MRFAKSGMKEVLEINPSDEELEDHIANQPERLKSLLILGVASTLCVVGVTYTALAILSNNQKVDYGQGVTQKTSCDEEMLVTPYAGFVNEDSDSAFTLDSVYIEGISQNCIGYDFILRVFDDGSSTPLTITSSSSPDETYDAARIHFETSTTFQVMGDGQIDALSVNEEIQSGEDQAVLIAFDADLITQFAKAGDIFKVTLQTVDHDASLA